MLPAISQDTICKGVPSDYTNKYRQARLRRMRVYGFKHPIPARRLAILAIIAGLILVQSVGTIRPSHAATSTVNILGLAFSPQNITIENGDTVSWTNNDPVVYTLWFTNASDGSTYLLSPPIDPGSTWTHTFPSQANLNVYDFDRLFITGHLNVVPILLADLTPTYSSSLTVTFFAPTSGGTGPYRFSWNFGDGTSGTGAQPTHTYRSYLFYNVTVTVTDSSTPSAFSVSVARLVEVNPTVEGGGRAPLRM